MRDAIIRRTNIVYIVQQVFTSSGVDQELSLHPEVTIQSGSCIDPCIACKIRAYGCHIPGRGETLNPNRFQERGMYCFQQTVLKITANGTLHAALRVLAEQLQQSLKHCEGHPTESGMQILTISLFVQWRLAGPHLTVKWSPITEYNTKNYWK